MVRRPQEERPAHRVRQAHQERQVVRWPQEERQVVRWPQEERQPVQRSAGPSLRVRQAVRRPREERQPVRRSAGPSLRVRQAVRRPREERQPVRQPPVRPLQEERTPVQVFGRASLPALRGLGHRHQVCVPGPAGCSGTEPSVGPPVDLPAGHRSDYQRTQYSFIQTQIGLQLFIERFSTGMN